MANDIEMDDQIIELTQIADSDPGGAEDEEIIELTAIESKDHGRQADDSLEQFSADQLEAALERVIEKKFAGNLENILFNAMEKVIEREIKQVRQSLQEELDQLEKS